MSYVNGTLYGLGYKSERKLVSWWLISVACSPLRNAC
jgi:hypothetical protein